MARHNIANALAAAGGARGLGMTREQIADGLADFRPTSDQMPGRLNLYRNGNRVVMVDFAHNEAGLGVAIDAAEALIGDRAARAGRAMLTVVVGTAGDRPDDTLRGLGRIAAARADQVAIKETLHYLRGRTRDSVTGELLAGAAESGVRGSDVPIYRDEALAVRGELCDEARMGREGPGVLLVMCHQDRSAVISTLDDLGFRPMEVEEVREVRTAASGA
jgi:cyanophycin synthetase